jgi:hypothetical protein
LGAKEHSKKEISKTSTLMNHLQAPEQPSICLYVIGNAVSSSINCCGIIMECDATNVVNYKFGDIADLHKQSYVNWSINYFDDNKFKHTHVRDAHVDASYI